MTSGQSEGYPAPLYDTAAHHANQLVEAHPTKCKQKCSKAGCPDDKQCLGSNNVCYDYATKQTCEQWSGFCWCGADPSKHNHMQSTYPHSFGQTGTARLPWPFQGSVPAHTHAQLQGPTGLSGEVTDTWPWPLPGGDPLLSHNHYMNLGWDGTPNAGPTSYDFFSTCRPADDCCRPLHQGAVYACMHANLCMTQPTCNAEN